MNEQGPSKEGENGLGGQMGRLVLSKIKEHFFLWPKGNEIRYKYRFVSWEVRK